MAGIRKRHSVLPGFGLTLGYSIFYLCLIVLIPLSALFLKTSNGASFPGPCAVNCTNGEDIGSQAFPYPAPYGSNGTGETYSFHPGIANVALGDGSVRSVKESVDIRVFARLVTRGGQEVIPFDGL